MKSTSGPATNSLKQTTARFTLPISKLGVGGWKDYDESVLKRTDLTIEDKVAYLRCRLKMVVFDPLDNVFLRSAPHHSAVNGPAMSFFFVGSTIICCCIEALGGFVLAQHRGNGMRFNAFIKGFMKDWAFTSPKGVDVTDWLWKNLRNGLAHGLIIGEGGMEDLGHERFRDQGKGKLHVHTEILYRDLKLGVETFFTNVTQTPKGILAKNFEKHFKDVFQKF